MSMLHRRKEREELLALSISLLLALIKGGAALFTGTLSLFASALDSLLDFFVSSLNFFTLVVAQRRPDEDHSFGHEKAEALGGLFQSLLIVVSAAYLIYSSFVRLRSPLTLQHLNEGIGVIVLSIVASLWLTYRLRKTAAETGSMVLRTDSLHYSMDLFSYGAILVAFALIQFTKWPYWDPLVTLPIAFYISFQGFRIGKEAVDELMDRERSPEAIRIVQRIVAEHEPAVVGMHNFKTRRAGSKRFIEFHVEMKRTLSFEQVHELTEKMVKKIRRALGNAHVIIHPDPEGMGVDESDLM